MPKNETMLWLLVRNLVCLRVFLQMMLLSPPHSVPKKYPIISHKQQIFNQISHLCSSYNKSKIQDCNCTINSLFPFLSICLPHKTVYKIKPTCQGFEIITWTALGCFHRERPGLFSQDMWWCGTDIWDHISMAPQPPRESFSQPPPRPELAGRYWAHTMCCPHMCASPTVYYSLLSLCHFCWESQTNLLPMLYSLMEARFFF